MDSIVQVEHPRYVVERKMRSYVSVRGMFIQTTNGNPSGRLVPHVEAVVAFRLVNENLQIVLLKFTMRLFSTKYPRTVFSWSSVIALRSTVTFAFPSFAS